MKIEEIKDYFNKNKKEKLLNTGKTVAAISLIASLIAVNQCSKKREELEPIIDEKPDQTITSSVEVPQVFFEHYTDLLGTIYTESMNANPYIKNAFGETFTINFDKNPKQRPRNFEDFFSSNETTYNLNMTYKLSSDNNFKSVSTTLAQENFDDFGAKLALLFNNSQNQNTYSKDTFQDLETLWIKNDANIETRQFNEFLDQTDERFYYINATCKQPLQEGYMMLGAKVTETEFYDFCESFLTPNNPYYMSMR
jgi:hypothetical protein